ncbi:MAG: type I-F CRISPR-associated endoribonuclease Cas6/Csy4 [Cocleimonas sp.]|nr:type I-F CRISPR-associated endoribonuclease Cas6/Csy4 [Cocleimonas sp.]
MKSYLDITLLPNADISLYFLWEKVYQQLHLALVERQQSNKTVKIGVAFPEYKREKFQLGSKLRLFAPSNVDLEKLNINNWLSRLSDYVHITSIREVPDKKIEGYAYFKRVQLKSNNARLARRKAKREEISLDEAQNFYQQYKEGYSRAPFIHIKSIGSNKRFRLLIEKVKVDTAGGKAIFSTYGLSSTSVVPLF